MAQSNSKLPEKEDRQVQEDLLAEIIRLHPGHLTFEELVVLMRGGLGDADPIEIRDPIDALKGAGLVRLNGNIVEPTHPLICASKIFEFP
jgi:hypothetical protein